MFFPAPYWEEQYTEPSLDTYYSDIEEDDFYSFSGTTQEDVEAVVHKLIYESFKEKYNKHQESKVFLRYIPTSFLEDIQYSYVPLVEVFLYKKDILSHINKLW